MIPEYRTIRIHCCTNKQGSYEQRAAVYRKPGRRERKESGISFIAEKNSFRKVGSSRWFSKPIANMYIYIYIRVIFEGRDEYLCGGAGRDGRWRARERKDKRNRLVSGGGVAAAAGFRGGPGFVTGGRKRSRPLITQLKWTGNHGSPVDVGLDDGHQTRRQRYYYRPTINATTGVTVIGGRGDPRCPWNSSTRRPRRWNLFLSFSKTYSIQDELLGARAFL